MRVLQVTERDRFGGQQVKFAWDLHRAFCQRPKVDAQMFVRRKFSVDPSVQQLPQNSGGWLANQLMDAGCQLQLRNRKLRGAWRLGELLKLASQPRRLFYRMAGFEDLAHPGSQRLLKLSSRTPDVLTIHGLEKCLDPLVLPGLSRKIPTVLYLQAPSDLSCFREPSPKNRRKVRWVGSILKKSSLSLLSPSKRGMEALLAAMPRTTIRNHRVVPFGVNQEVFYPDDQTAAKASLRLERDVRVILASFDTNVQRTQTGNPSESLILLRNIIARTTRNFGINKPILVIGLGSPRPAERVESAEIRYLRYPKNPEIMANLYRAADLYLHLSETDLFPVKVIEAMSSGVPIVAPLNGDIAEQVEDGVEGVLSRHGVASDLAHHISTILSDETLRKKLGEQGATRATRQFNIESTTKDLICWFREILRRNTG